jgi:CTP-dependent riboflavin kinase
MIILRGLVCPEGLKHFSRRMREYSEVFERATGEHLYPGTLNVNVGKPIPIREHFRIRGTEINEPEQDFLFEVCHINQIWAYRIRPFHLVTGGGGYGDHIVEIACSRRIPNVLPGTQVEIALFPRD